MTHGTSRRRNSVILAAALAATSALFMTHSASAQYANGDGHAHDANTRVGGGGYNSPSSVGNGVNGNNIINRNVTNGQGFSGPISPFEQDGRGFTGPTGPDPSEIFARQSNAPVNSTGIPQATGQPKQYYGDNRFAPPPAGSIPLGFSGGYVSDTPNTPSSLASGFTVATDANSLQARANPQSLLMDRALKSGDTATIINQMEQSGTLDVSPVYGLRTTDNGTGIFNSLDLSGSDRTTADQLTLLRMQQELNENSATPNANNPNGVNAKNPNGVQPVQPSPDGTQPPVGLNDPVNNLVGRGFDAPVNPAISNRVTGSQLPDSQLPSTGIISANPGKIPSMIPPAEQQSTLLATLQHRLEESGGVGKALVGNIPPARPTTVKPGTAAGVDQGPLQVSSLADGIRAKGLRDLLSGSEDLVRTGKFESAIQKYDQAQRVAPNNPLPLLGRAQAELAGGYYAKAEADLRAVFRADPALMLMRFDLAALLPKDRLAYLRKDLHDLAAADPKAERPWFVLAYLDYNTGDAVSADKDLNEADQRANGGDASVRALRNHWALPSSKTPAGFAPKTPVTPTPAPSATPTPALNK